MVLTIAGTDPSAGAGIYQDLQVFRDLGCHGAAAITAVVWQNTQAVGGWQAMEPAALAKQLRAVVDDMDLGAIKIGMVPTGALVAVVAKFLGRLAGQDRRPPVVFDPVMASGDGEAALMTAAGRQAMATLIEHVDLITPNALEAQILAGKSAGELEAAALIEALGHKGWARVLLKGGHLSERGDEVVDWYGDWSGDCSGDVFDEGPAIEALPGLARVPWDVRGTGCQLSSAIAAGRAQGLGWQAAVMKGRRYLNELLQHGAAKIGRGRPVIVRAEEER